MWHYLFIIGEEAQRMLRARSSRSGISRIPSARSGGTALWRARVTGEMAGSLFLRSLERSDRVYHAMLARGYNGEIRSLPFPPIPFSSWLIFLVCIFLITFLLTAGQIYW